MLRVPRDRALPLVAALVAVSAGVRYAAARGVPTPWVAPDEQLYGLLARSLADTGHLQVLGAPVGFYSLVYPALIALPLSLDDLALGYELAKAVGALVLSLTAVAVYLWGRTAMRRRWALCAAVLTLACGGLTYAGML